MHFGLINLNPPCKITHPNATPVEVSLISEFLWNPIAKKTNSEMKNEDRFNTFLSISLKLANQQTCPLPCQGLFNDIKSKVEGRGGGEPTVWEGYNMVTSKQANKHLSSYIVSHILKLWISMDCCLYFISSIAYSLLEFQTLRPSLPPQHSSLLGLHQGLPGTTYRVNYLFPHPHPWTWTSQLYNI